MFYKMFTVHNVLSKEVVLADFYVSSLSYSITCLICLFVRGSPLIAFIPVGWIVQFFPNISSVL